MVREEEKHLIRQCVDALREGIPGFKSRRPQMEMIAAVANTLSRCRAEDEQAGNGDHLAIVEAGTGTGKSFGALVPALVMAMSRQKRLVVSSSTVALQHQYAEKDAPSLQRLVPIPFTFAVAKGRRRYACTAKLQAEGKLAGQGGLDLAGERGPGGAEDAPRRVAVMRELLASFDAGRWSGDRDELPLPVVDEVWDRVTTDRQGCAGSKCPEFARCPFQAARQRVKEADLVIANHDLVLSAIDMDGASVLPPPQETIYVFDEAHSLAAKAVEHFSARHALRGAIDWLEGACNAVRDAVLGLRLDEQLIRDSRASAERIERALRDLHHRIHGTNGFAEKRARLTQFGAFIEELPPGSASGYRHWHETEDEIVYVLDGTVTLVEETETDLCPGDVACWPAGSPIGHRLENRGDAPVRYLVIGTRHARDVIHYSDHDLITHKDGNSRRHVRRDGTDHPNRRPT